MPSIDPFKGDLLLIHAKKASPIDPLKGSLSYWSIERKLPIDPFKGHLRFGKGYALVRGTRDKQLTAERSVEVSQTIILATDPTTLFVFVGLYLHI